MASGGQEEYVEKKPLMVAAIDFGTTYSGYAFSLRYEFEKDPLKISTYDKWNAGNLMSLKTPTVLYYDPGEKDSTRFGYRAEDKYVDVIQGKDKKVLNRCFYFSLFKMELYGDKNVSKDFEIQDISGKKMKALDVFKMSIKWLKDHLFDLIKLQGKDIDESEIQWVLTVPAIWTDAAKQFMRLAGEAAGMSRDRLIIALEPEAASVYCQHVPIDKHVFQGETVFSELDIDSKFVVADLGGGTADITVHQKLRDNYLKELLRASGGDHGGNVVNKSYLEFWTTVVGTEAMTEFKRDYKEDYMDMLREFEITKRTALTKDRPKVTVRISAALSKLCEKHNNKAMDVKLKESMYKGNLEVVRDKLRIMANLFRVFFEPTINCILELIKKQLSQEKAKDANLIVMVGGFAECHLVQQMVHEFTKGGNVKVIVPEDPGLAVLKGAVIYGHNPRIIKSRITRFTYGISSAPSFDSRRHKADKRIEMHGRYYCKDVFSPFMLIDTTVEYGHIVTKHATTVEPYQNNLKFELFQSNSLKPQYTTDTGCQRLGNFVVRLPNLTESHQEVKIEYEFGQTLIKVTAYMSGGEPCTTSFHL